MQTDILLKQLGSSLNELKTAIDKFEKHDAPSTQYAEQLYNAINSSNKLVSAYLVLKEKKDVAPDLDIHLKLMNVPTTVTEKQIVADIEPIATKVIEEEKTIIEIKSETIVQAQVAEPEIIPETKVEIKPIEPPIIQEPVKPVAASPTKELPKLTININDKFRFINELFKTNANEYKIAIEQLNIISSLEEANSYLKGLQEIYEWKDDHEMVKKLISLTQKRFA